MNNYNNNELERKWSWPNLNSSPSFYLEGLRKTTKKHLDHDGVLIKISVRHFPNTGKMLPLERLTQLTPTNLKLLTITSDILKFVVVTNTSESVLGMFYITAHELSYSTPTKCM